MKRAGVLVFSFVALSLVYGVIARIRSVRKRADEEGLDIPNKKIPGAAGRVS